MSLAAAVGGCSGSNNKRGHPAPSAKRLMRNCAIELALPLLLCLLSLQTQTGAHGGPTHGDPPHPPSFLFTTTVLETEQEEKMEQLSQGIDVLRTGLNRENNAASSTPSSQPCSYPSSLHCSTRLHTRGALPFPLSSFHLALHFPPSIKQRYQLQDKLTQKIRSNKGRVVNVLHYMPSAALKVIARGTLGTSFNSLMKRTTFTKRCRLLCASLSTSCHSSLTLAS